MTDYLTANRGKVKAIIGLGDLVTGSIKRVFDRVGIKPRARIPVVGWGNSTRHHAGSAGWLRECRPVAGPAGNQLHGTLDCAMAASGIPTGFNIITGELYEKDNAQIYDKIMCGK